MKMKNKQTSIIRTHFFICLFLRTNFIFAKTNGVANSNSKTNATQTADFSEKTKQEKKQDIIKKNSQDIMSTTGDFLALSNLTNS